MMHGVQFSPNCHRSARLFLFFLLIICTYLLCTFCGLVVDKVADILIFPTFLEFLPHVHHAEIIVLRFYPIDILVNFYVCNQPIKTKAFLTFFTVALAE